MTHLPAAGLIPYVTVADARAAIRWYGEVFGAEAVGDPIVMADNRVGHAELALFGATLYLSDAHPEIGVVAPVPGAGADVTLHASVSDLDALYAAACAAGAEGVREPVDTPHGRTGVLIDPAGHRWMLNQDLPG